MIAKDDGRSIAYCRSVEAEARDCLPALAAFAAAMASEIELIQKFQQGEAVSKDELVAAHQKSAELKQKSVSELEPWLGWLGWEELS